MTVTTKAQARRLDATCFEMFENAVWWVEDETAPDLRKAPPVWSGDEDVPDYVRRQIEESVGSNVHHTFAHLDGEDIQLLREQLRENLTQPQGWSVRSLIEDLVDATGVDEKYAVNTVRTETAAVLNSAREDGYRDVGMDASEEFRWKGPDDHRTTIICTTIKERVAGAGGSLPLRDLKSVVRQVALTHRDHGGTPERADQFLPHFNCRHTFVRV